MQSFRKGNRVWDKMHEGVSRLMSSGSANTQNTASSELTPEVGRGFVANQGCVASRPARWYVEPSDPRARDGTRVGKGARRHKRQASSMTITQQTPSVRSKGFGTQWKLHPIC